MGVKLIPEDYQMHVQALDGLPTKEGWYIARMKTWSIHDGWAVVRVRKVDSRNFDVWQVADDRPWKLEDFEWRGRIWPGS